MIEFAVVVGGALVIIGAVIELWMLLHADDEKKYEAESKARLLGELRRQR